MEKNEFIELLNKYLEGNATADEQNFITNYYNVFKDDQDVLNLLDENSRNALKSEISAKIWETIGARERPDTKIRNLRNWSLSIAVAAILFISGITGWIYYQKRSDPAPALTTVVLKGKDNQAVSLPDGSSVMLCAGSELRYPVSFKGQTKREVYLKGQAFFDIHHDESNPFVVVTGKVQTTVLGTAFNVKAFENENDITVTVQRGRVRVNNEDKELCVITPSRQVVYNKQNSAYIQNVVTDDGYLSWKESDLRLDNKTIREAADLLEKRYNVSISINNQSGKEKRFTATFSKTQSLEKCLNAICAFNNCSFSYDKEKGTVSVDMP